MWPRDEKSKTAASKYVGSCSSCAIMFTFGLIPLEKVKNYLPTPTHISYGLNRTTTIGHLQVLLRH